MKKKPSLLAIVMVFIIEGIVAYDLAGDKYKIPSVNTNHDTTRFENLKTTNETSKNRKITRKKEIRDKLTYKPYSKNDERENYELILDGNYYNIDFNSHENSINADEDGFVTITYGEKTDKQIIIYDYSLENILSKTFEELNGDDYNKSAMRKFKSLLEKKNISREELIQSIKKYFFEHQSEAKENWNQEGQSYLID